MERVHGGLDRELLDAHLRVEELGDRVGQGAERDRMNAGGVRHHRHLDRRVRRQVRDDASVGHDAGFQHALLVVQDAADRRGAALARRRQPIGRQGCAGEHAIQRVAEFRASALVGGEIVAVLAAFPAIGQIFAEMIVAAGHPVAEGPEQPPGERRERRVEVLLLGAQQRIKVFAGCAVADLQQALGMIEAGAPDLDLLVGQPHDVARRRLVP